MMARWGRSSQTMSKAPEISVLFLGQWRGERKNIDLRRLEVGIEGLMARSWAVGVDETYPIRYKG